MKKLHKLRSVFGGLALGSALLSCIPLAQAANSDYFTTTAGSYSWDAANWSTASGGPFTANWVAGDFARFLGTSGTFTVTNNTAATSFAGMLLGSAITVNVTNAGTGSLSMVANSATVTQNGFSWLNQGMFTGGGTINIYTPIIGTGGVGQNSGGGNLNLYGVNTFTGGFLVTSSGTFIGYNNNASFGATASQIGFQGTTFAIMNNTGPTTVNIPNKVQTIGQTGVDWIGNSSTFSGTWYLGGGASQISLRNNGAAGSVVTLSGVLSATTGPVIYSGANGGSILLSAANTYTGPTIVGTSGGDTSITLEVASTGSLASTVVTNNGATLQLDAATCLKTNAVLQLIASPAAGSVVLNFSGTQSIAGLYIGGVLQLGGTYGSSTSGATYQLAAFTGNGVLSTPAAPSIAQQPSSEAAFPGGSATFSVVASGAAPLTYQWYFGSTAIGGANSSSYTISPVGSGNVGSYKVVVANSVSSVTSSVVSLSLVETNAYTQSIVADGAIAYYRLDETTGTAAHDVINGYNGTYTNVTLGQPGFSVLDTDTSIGLPTSTSSRGYVNIPLPSNNAFNFDSTEPFTFEGWAYFTNLTGVQRLFSTLGNGNGYAFGINGNNIMRFTQGAVQDADATLASSNMLVTGVWYQLAVTFDGFSTYTYYINGQQVGTAPLGGVGVPNNGAGNPATSPMALGADPVQYTFTAEQVTGNLDEMAIYNTCLTTQILNHYNMRYGTLQAPVVSAPIASPATNYASLSSSIQAVAAGQALTYQWYQTPSTMLSGQTGSTLTISPLVSSASYYVNVSNPAGNSNSPAVTLTVLPIPTTATQLNLTNALVLHLPFDGDYGDISGRSNNGTNVGATTFVSPGAVGSTALSYSSSTSPASFNYVTLGVRPDLQFSSNIDFSVSYWIKQPAGSTFTNLPFFTDAINSTANGGFAFAPYKTTSSSGGWIWTVGSVTSPNQFTSFPDANVINDGNWHHLVHVAQRSANLTTYLDGVQVDSQSISFIGSINTANAATIGQDPTGAYPATASAYIDDLGVWQRTLSPLEVSGIYLAGATNSVTFAPAVASTVIETLTVQVVAGQTQLSWSGTANLQASPSLLPGSWTNVVGATSPYTVTSPSTQMFYRLHP